MFYAKVFLKKLLLLLFINFSIAYKRNTTTFSYQLSLVAYKASTWIQLQFSMEEPKVKYKKHYARCTRCTVVYSKFFSLYICTCDS